MLKFVALTMLALAMTSLASSLAKADDKRDFAANAEIVDSEDLGHALYGAVANAGFDTRNMRFRFAANESGLKPTSSEMSPSTEVWVFYAKNTSAYCRIEAVVSTASTADIQKDGPVARCKRIAH